MQRRHSVILAAPLPGRYNLNAALLLFPDFMGILLAVHLGPSLSPSTSPPCLSDVATCHLSPLSYHTCIVDNMLEKARSDDGTEWLQWPAGLSNAFTD
jgi:hypothetical protein